MSIWAKMLNRWASLRLSAGLLKSAFKSWLFVNTSNYTPFTYNLKGSKQIKSPSSFFICSTILLGDR